MNPLNTSGRSKVALQLLQVTDRTGQSLDADVRAARSQVVESACVLEQALGKPDASFPRLTGEAVAPRYERGDVHDVFMGDTSPTVKRDTSPCEKNDVRGIIPSMAIDVPALRALVGSSGKSARAVSLEANLGATALKDIFSGKSKKPEAETLSRIAGVLGVPLSSFFNEDLVDSGPSRQLQLVPRFLEVRYRARAGRWFELDSEEPPKQPAMAVVPDPRYAQWPQWLEQVEGDSANLKIPDGHFAHVVDAFEMGYEPKANDWVVVERRRDQGAIRERTIKQVAIDDQGRVVLWPRSTNPKWNKPVEMCDGGRPGEEGIEAFIVGLVIGAYNADF